MLPRSFLTKCSSLLSLMLRAWTVRISSFSSVLGMDEHYIVLSRSFNNCGRHDLDTFFWV